MERRREEEVEGGTEEEVDFHLVRDILLENHFAVFV